MACEVCNFENPADARFCMHCGARLVGAPDHETTQLIPAAELEAAREELEAAFGELPADQAVLVVRRGPNAGTKYVVAGDRVRIGRHPDSEFFLDDVTVSRRHAELGRDGDRFVIKDAGSLNGTYVNDERVESAELTSGDEVRIGKYVIAFIHA